MEKDEQEILKYKESKRREEMKNRGRYKRRSKTWEDRDQYDRNGPYER